MKKHDLLYLLFSQQQAVKRYLIAGAVVHVNRSNRASSSLPCNYCIFSLLDCPARSRQSLQQLHALQLWVWWKGSDNFATILTLLANGCGANVMELTVRFFKKGMYLGRPHQHGAAFPADVSKAKFALQLPGQMVGSVQGMHHMQCLFKGRRPLNMNQLS